jgi:hypothetical protein
MRDKIIRFCNIDCVLDFQNYVGPHGKKGPVCINLVAASTKHNDAEDVFAGEPVATATVNEPKIELQEHEVIIKNWSENLGIFEVLENAGVITRTEKYVDFGNVVGCIAILNEEYRQVM